MGTVATAPEAVPAPGPAPAHRDRNWGLFLAALTVALAIPYALMGPGFFREDWVHIARLDHCGIRCVTNEFPARPVMIVLYDALFSLFGRHPVGCVAVLTALLAASAVALFRLGAVFVDRGTALLIAVTWVVLPTHGALSHWAAAVHIDLALLLLLIGVRRVATARRRPTAGLALLIAAGLCYEAMFPVAIVAVLLCRGRGASRRFTMVAVASIAVPAAWGVFAQHHRVMALARFPNLVTSNFGFGGPLLLAAVVIGAVIAARRTADPMPRRLVLTGLALLIIGYLPFITAGYDVQFIGLGDRGNVVSAIGGAMLWVAAAHGLTKNRRLAAIAVTALCLVALPLRIEEDHNYARTAADVQRTVHCLERTINCPRPDTYVGGVNLDQEVRLASRVTRVNS